MNARTCSLFVTRGLIAAVAAMVVGLHLATAAAADKTNKLSASVKGATNAPAKPAPIEIPTSQFIIPSTATEGRNPFFPDSLVLPKAIANANTNTAATKAPAATLDLKGISGAGNKRFALINGRTFEVGEEADVGVAGGRSKVRVQCISIGEDSVTVEVDGVRRALRLRPGL